MHDMNSQDQVDFTRTIMMILDDWGLSAEAIISVLGLPDKMPKRNLRKFRENMPFPEADGLLQRLEHVVGIATSLRTTYPMNPQMGTLWMHKPQRLFDNRTPLDVIVHDGEKGLVAVRSHLDCTYDWRCDDQRAGRL